MDIGNRLKSLRKEKKATQKQVAEILGVKQNTYAQYESGVRQPNLDMLAKLSRYFLVGVDDILGLNAYVDKDDFIKLKVIAKIMAEEFSKENNIQNFTAEELEAFFIDVIFDSVMIKITD